jgi:hypothetical protein
MDMSVTIDLSKIIRVNTPYGHERLEGVSPVSHAPLVACNHKEDVKPRQTDSDVKIVHHSRVKESDVSDMMGLIGKKTS